MTVVGLDARGAPRGASLLYPICAYFVVFSRSARAASMDFLQRARGRPCGLARRVRALSSLCRDHLRPRVPSRRPRPRIRVRRRRARASARRHGGRARRAAVRRTLRQLRSAAQHRRRPLAGAHTRPDARGQRAQAQRDARRAQRVRRASDVIVLGRPETMLEVRDALRAGEIVGLLADRASPTTARWSAISWVRASVSAGPVHARVPPRGPGRPVLRGVRRQRRLSRALRAIARRRRRETPTSIAVQVQRYASWLEANCRARSAQLVQLL